MCKNKKELNKLVEKYREITAEQKKLNEKLKAIKADIIEYVLAKGTVSETNENSLIVFGDGYKVAYITVISHPLDSDKIKELLGDKLPEYQTTSSSNKLDIR
jgi:regulator of replication initiation timing